ncbi:uncharacterized protein LOC110183489 [Drosophila serrata]|uniref:uncharacterized protein LOC110183489 n=1 Tax=Drosophila serrata TaxID=7274 RepID=UPI000A1D2BA0|nr:uncharacterized protein LOC110183489 [Drosophila serrata]
MWYQKHTMNPQPCVPVVHEQIALQCARSILRMTSTLPQPPSRTPSGHVPILVELRCTDEPTVYRYQVNMPSWSLWPQEPKPPSSSDSSSDPELQVLMLPESTDSLVPKLPEIPPCPMHGPSGRDAMPVSTKPLVMSQSFVHVVDPLDFSVNPTIITTCSAPPMAGKVADSIQEHFEATLFEERQSPLSYENIWLPDDPEAVTASASDSASASVSASASASYYTPASSPISLSPRRYQDVPPPTRRFPQQLFLDENNEYVDSSEERPTNGPRTEAAITRSEWARIPELCLDSNGEYVPNQLLQRPLNGYRLENQPVQHPPRQQQQQHQQQQQPHQQMHHQKQQQPPAHPPMRLNGLNGFKTPKSFPPQLNGIHKNGYKPADQYMAYTDQDKVMRLRFQEHFNDWSKQVPARGEQHMERLINQMTTEPLPRVTGNLFLDAVVPAEALPQPHSYREPPTFFRWNYCTLCHTAMRTVRNSVDHYTSRAHERRVSTFLGRLRFDKNLSTNPALGDILALPEQVLRFLHKDRPSDLYCDLCDLRLTSIIHAEQHFFGRRHRQMERQMSEDHGIYTMQSHWMRKDTKLLMCELCDVSITSESQMAMHISGIRHRKRAHIARARGIFGLGPIPVDGSHMFEINNNGTLAPLRPQVSSAIQYRPWGDPSAAYYCEACNVTLNHLKSVRQHENGRMHQRNLVRLPQK